MSGYMKNKIEIAWREASPPNHHEYKVISDQQVVNKELSLQRVI